MVIHRSVIHCIRETRCGLHQFVDGPYQRHTQPLAAAGTETRPWGQRDTAALEQFPGGILITPALTTGHGRQGEPQVHRHLWTGNRPTTCREGLHHTIPALAIDRMQLLRPIREGLQRLDRTLLQSQALIEIDDSLGAPQCGNHWRCTNRKTQPEPS